MIKFRWLLAGLLCLAAATSARASFILTVGDLTLQPGQTGTVDVYIRSTDGDVLDLCGVQFNITTSGSTQLAFVNPFTDPHLSDANYLFFGDSSAQTFSQTAILSTLTSNDTYVSGDGTLSGNGVLIPTVDTLLLRMEVTTLTGSAPQAGDSFTISLNTANGQTFFLDPNFNDLELNDQSKLSGTVTVGATVSVVPVPPSLVMCLAAALTTFVGYFVHRRLIQPVRNKGLVLH